MIDKVVSHYKILEKLGEGGMGVVYKAKHLKLDSSVALKFLSPHLITDDTAKQRFVHEAKAASSLQHPNICSVFDIDETADGTMFIVMPYYEGETLQNRIARGRVGLSESLEITRQIASALAKAHETGIIHRDVKPGNVLITSDGHVRLLDFGLAKLTGGTRVTTTGKTVGTVAYMSPEQVRGEDVDARSDIFSLGVVLYELLTGELPFQADHPAAVMYSITNKEPRRLSEFDPAFSSDLQRMIDRALQKDPSQRYPSMDDFLKDLLHAKRQSEPATTGGRSQRISVRPVAFMALAAVVLAVAGFAAFDRLGPKGAEHETVVTADKELAADDKFIVVVAPFWGADAAALEDGRVMQALVQRKIEDVLGNEKDVEILGGDVLETPRSHAEARALGKKLGATMVLWGEVLVLRGEVEIQPFVTVASETKLGDRSTDPLQSTLAAPDQLRMRRAKAEETGNMALLVSAAYYGVKDPERALALLKRVSPPSGESCRTQARIYWAMDQYPKAVELLKEALEHDPIKPADIYSDLAWTYYKIGDLDQGVAMAEKALAIDPNHMWAHRNVGVIYKNQRKYEQAIRELKTSIELEPDKYQPHEDLALMYSAQGHADEAIGAMKKAIALSPDRARLHSELGAIYGANGEYDAAAIECSKAIALDSTFASPRYYLAMSYAASGMYDKAIGECVQGSMIDSSDARFPYGLAQIYYSRGELERSIAAAKTASVDSIGTERVYGSLSIMAEARDAQGQHDEAVAVNQKIIRLFPIEHSYVRYFICLYRAGDVDAARSMITAAVDGFKKDTWGKTIACFYAGRITEGALLEASKNSSPRVEREQKCEAYYYIGMAHMLGVGNGGAAARPDTEKAIVYFRESVDTRVMEFSEYWRALRELNRLKV